MGSDVKYVLWIYIFGFFLFEGGDARLKGVVLLTDRAGATALVVLWRLFDLLTSIC